MGTQQRTELSATLTESEQEARNIRRLQLMISMVMSVISQDQNLTWKRLRSWRPTPSAPRWPCFPTKNLPTTSFTNLGCSA